MRRRSQFVVFALAFLCSLPALAEGRACPNQEQAQKICDKTGCPSSPLEPLECWPSQYGPADANVVDSATNFLYCNGPYALCFYSGPPESIGTGDDPTLPCVLEENGEYANCRCQLFNGDNYVDIYAIQNRALYLATVAACGADGSQCQNMLCMNDPRVDCPDQVAPVCEHILAQGSGSPDAFYPKAAAVSTYSTEMQSLYGYPDPAEPTYCATGLYAGCMTAACDEPGDSSDGQFTTCRCPTYTGCYQVPKVENFGCDLGTQNDKTYVWSSSNNVASINPETCEALD